MWHFKSKCIILPVIRCEVCKALLLQMMFVFPGNKNTSQEYSCGKHPPFSVYVPERIVFRGSACKNCDEKEIIFKRGVS